MSSQFRAGDSLNRGYRVFLFVSELREMFPKIGGLGANNGDGRRFVPLGLPYLFPQSQGESSCLVQLPP
jgi:hypothetical protein